MRRAGELVRSPALRDWSVPLVVGVIGIVDIAMNAHSKTFPGSPWVNVTFLLAAALPLGFRRFRPATAAVLCVALVSAWDGVLYPVKDQASFEAFLLMLAASYILGTDLRGRRQQVVSGIVLLWILPGWLFGLGTGESPGNIVPALSLTLLAWLVGFTLRRRKEQAAVQRERADRLAFDQGRLAAEAVIEERSRIARELHDVVAHSLSLMVVQASAERRALRVGHSDPSSTEQVLESVENTGREALVELRRLLGLIRRSDEVPSRAPQPTLRHLDTLLEPIRASGIAVTLEADEVADLPPGLDLAAFRVVQESLTNVVKHAAAREVAVRIRRQATSLEIEVIDDGAGEPAGAMPVGGHGLVGMRERVAMYDGTLEAGPRSSGTGFRVHVRLPVAVAVPVPR